MKSVVIHQTLHGYSEGHRLLNGSVKLGSETGRLILRMSDLSGSSGAAGFEEYLTGYPLESSSFYAFAKTWYAAEMPRPGCVWTHTLLIPKVNMAEIPDLQNLVALFVRPQGSDFGKQFSKPIEFDPTRCDYASASRENFSVQIADLMNTLYVKGQSNIIIGARSSSAYEAPLIRVWSQQWPALRSAFSFCTGALSARGYSGKPFDVQCSPSSLVREISSTAVSKLSRELSLLVKNDQPQFFWFTRAVEDAIKPNGGTFRQLLWQFADKPRVDSFGQFARLIDKFLDFSQRNASELIRLVAELYPGVSEGVSVKTALFLGNEDLPGFKCLDEVEVLLALALTPHFEAYNPESLQLKARGNRLCLRDPSSVREIILTLFGSPINHLGEVILSGIVETINPSIAQLIAAEQPQLLPALFRVKPELGFSPLLWRAAGERRRDLLDSILLNNDLSSVSVERIVFALLDSDSEFLLRRGLEAWGRPAVEGVFGWLCNSKGNLSEHSLYALTFHVEEIVTWLLTHDNCPQHVAIAAAHIVAPYSYQFKHLDSRVWVDNYKELAKRGKPKEAIYFAALLLALGLQDAPPNALSLVEECFERVHQAAWDDALPDGAWIVLDPLVPHLFWLHDWDKCERLRRGLIEAFVRYRWPLQKLASCVKNEHFLPRVLHSAKKVAGGREFISQEI